MPPIFRKKKAQLRSGLRGLSIFRRGRKLSNKRVVRRDWQQLRRPVEAERAVRYTRRLRMLDETERRFRSRIAGVSRTISGDASRARLSRCTVKCVPRISC